MSLPSQPVVLNKAVDSIYECFQMIASKQGHLVSISVVGYTRTELFKGPLGSFVVMK